MLLSLAKQIHPPITSVDFAAGGSVLDHRFGKGDAYTLGVEEEYMLLDPGSLRRCGARDVDAVRGATAEG